MLPALKVARPSANTNHRPCLRSGLLGVLLLLMLAAPALGGTPISGTPTALQPLLGDSDSFAMEINNRGEVAGRSVGAVTTAVVWDRSGNPTMLMPLEGDFSALAEGINNRGEVAGVSRSGQGACPDVGFDTAVVWNRHGVPTALPPLPGDLESRAFAINENGVVIGTSLGTRGVNVPTACEAIFTPVKWDRNGNATKLPALPGFLEGFAQDLNNRGDVVGGSIDFSLFPFITGTAWGANNVPAALSPPAGYFDTATNGNNNNGLVTGETFDLGLGGLPDRAVVWDRKGNATTLPPLDGDPDSAGQAINNRGAVAGNSGFDLFGFFGLPTGTAVVWDKHGVPTALNPLAGETDSFASGINDPGHVVGRSFNADTGTNTAVVWR